MRSFDRVDGMSDEGWVGQGKSRIHELGFVARDKERAKTGLSSLQACQRGGGMAFSTATRWQMKSRGKPWRNGMGCRIWRDCVTPVLMS